MEHVLPGGTANDGLGVAAEDAGDVLDRLAGAQTDLRRGEVEGVGAEPAGRDLEG